ncbi:glycyl-tRNA synthetase beta chain [Granulicella rosea]|uniref:Glycine--tRNA ligase beta subunit n=1 Tax=Granulicella rosea TaxID=474952 RepID=A0A239E341_9BACT|nr:glycine--tRNA ligase subunit beta [Granulicella rosea]SNS39150.1 glycyl-tRNA synthetase beta chain [Granulicella rosea]
MSEFLFEIGLEEIPARMIAAAEAELLRRTVALLERERLIPAGAAAKSFSTPRRLAVLIHHVAERQDDVAEELTGPATKIAFKDGAPGPAAIAFAKKAGIAVEELKVIQTPKGEYIAATTVKPGRTAAEVIAAELPKELSAIYWPKNMHWRPGRPSNPDRFVRPVRWLVALLGHAIVPVEFGGYTASDVTYGHRVLQGPAPVQVKSPASYAATLNEAFVMADVELRRHTIRKALDHVCRTIQSPAGCRWREDHALVDKLTHLTEWPSVIAGAFDPEYLTLPEEVLVTVMRDHQNYFAVEDKEGKLAAHFLAVLNTVPDERAAVTIQHGNARVLRARFNDARFFWEFDQRTPFAERVDLLENVTFQKDLGSYAVKSSRVVTVSGKLGAAVSGKGFAFHSEALLDAAKLAKVDLTCELVKEFTELQGIIGGLYARAAGLSETTAAAIYDQYTPASMEDRIPSTAEGCLLGIADRIDTIAGMFSLGLEPTGSKDPFALRRAANSIVKILADSQLPLTLSEVIAAASPSDEVAAKLKAFFAERLDFFLREAKGQAYDVVKAVLAVGADDPRDAVARAEAVSAVRSSDDFAAVSAAFKRMKNILAQAAEKSVAAAASVDDSLLTDPSEKALAEHSAILAGNVQRLRAAGDFKAALEAIATLRSQVDAFFEAVMVMAPEPEIRANRLALLQKVLADFSGIAEFSEIVTAG